MRFHVISLPHTQTTKEYVNCAYTEKVRRFCMMMKSLGHTVYLYASEDNEAPVDELITCITKEQQQEALAGKHYTEALAVALSKRLWLVSITQRQALM